MSGSDAAPGFDAGANDAAIGDTPPDGMGGSDATGVDAGAGDAALDGADADGSDAAQGRDSGASDGAMVPDAGPSQVRFAVLSASNSDEYRADDSRGGAYAAVTHNWVEQLVLARDMDFGRWDTWGGSRRTGFEYNWARSGARTSDMLQGQAPGVASQVEMGQVDYVIMQIGGNDFSLANGAYQEIYNGSLSDQGVAQKVRGLIGDMQSAIDMILAASPERLLVTTFVDPGQHPLAAAIFPNAGGRDRVTGAIAAVNSALDDMARSRPAMTMIDFGAFLSSVFASADRNGNIFVGGEAITLSMRGNEPHHAQLADRAGHAGTVLSGLFANMFVEALNDSSGLGIAPLRDSEILGHAGLP